MGRASRAKEEESALERSTGLDAAKEARKDLLGFPIKGLVIHNCLHTHRHMHTHTHACTHICVHAHTQKFLFHIASPSCCDPSRLAGKAAWRGQHSTVVILAGSQDLVTQIDMSLALR